MAFMRNLIFLHRKYLPCRKRSLIFRFLSKNLGDETLRSLGSLGMQRMEELDLSGSCNLSDRGLVHLKSLYALTSLDLTNCYAITDTGIGHLQSLTNLTNLNL